MRSRQEISFRLRQEAANAWMWCVPPRWQAPFSMASVLPAPKECAGRVRGSVYAAELEQWAEQLLEHRFTLLGLAPAELGDPIAWRRDFMHGQETGTAYFRRIPYLDFTRAGDHKIIWELNRQQHLVTLGQAFLVTGRSEFLAEIPRQVESWMTANPFQCGINWASALEVAFRALSWMWTLHLVGPQLDAAFVRRWTESLYQHGLHLEHNLSVYFSPNTHLLGEAVALHALGRLFPAMPGAERWRATGGTIVQEAMDRQVREDGSHFEQSSYYHVYALDFFLLHALLEPTVSAGYRAKLTRMAEFLDALVSSRGVLPLLGDEDGGRLFHPYGDRRQFAEATLATCAHWLGRPEWVRRPEAYAVQGAWWCGGAGPQSTGQGCTGQGAAVSRWFPDTGLAVLHAGGAHVIVDAGTLGSGSAGHSHADALSMVAFYDGREVLIDPGTRTYVADPALREQYRGTASHNTVSIDSLEQADPQGPFRWTHPPQVQLLGWEEHSVDACCQYRGFTHRRTVLFAQQGTVVVVDRVSGGPGGGQRHSVEQRWLCAAAEDLARLQTEPSAMEEPAQRSQALGSEQPAWRKRAVYQGPLPAVLVAVISLGELLPQEDAAAPRVSVQAEDVTVQCAGGTAWFPERGVPEWR